MPNGIWSSWLFYQCCTTPVYWWRRRGWWFTWWITYQYCSIGYLDVFQRFSKRVNKAEKFESLRLHWLHTASSKMTENRKLLPLTFHQCQTCHLINRAALGLECVWGVHSMLIHAPVLVRCSTFSDLTDIHAHSEIEVTVFNWFRWVATDLNQISLQLLHS